MGGKSSITTTITARRLVSGSMTTLYSGLPVQIDGANEDEVGYQPDHSSPADTFLIYLLWGGYTLLRGDELTDEVNGGNPYNVLNNPRSQADGHVEIKAYQVIGT